MKDINDIYGFYAPYLDKIENIILERCNNKIPIIKDIIKYVMDSGGKRIRPLITLISTNLFREIDDNVLNLAAAIELIHTATLLHDDVIDESDIRRNKPTVNNAWSNKNSILMGDFLFSQAFELMVATKSLKSLEMLSETSSIISEGEMLQLSISNNINLSTDQYYKVINAKTSALFSASAVVPCLLLEEHHKHYEALYNIGNNIGTSFQIQDDLMDYYRTEKSSKKLGDDFFEGKVTLPIIKLKERCSMNELNIVEKIWENEDFSDKNLEYIILLMNNYNIPEIIIEHSKTNLEKCFKLMLKNNYNNVASDSMQTICKYIVNQYKE